ncbi:MAG: methyltransferase domain-containing protein [Thermoanaerobaculales bacterium]|nr:methyltransferase domain-containing protein [Thermoanaerobaculales bacterium]
MGGDDHAAPPDPTQPDGQDKSPLYRWAKSVFALTPWGLQRRLENQRADLQKAEERISQAIQTIQSELEELRDRRIDPLEKRFNTAESAIRDVSREIGRLRDEVFPASVARADALLERLAEELEEIASLSERSLRREPLPVSGASPLDEGRLADALVEVQPLLLESFRGSEEEIQHRLDRYLTDLRPAAPVLDLGCGRGELLLLLREAGVEATGVEGDPALAEAARRRGLEIVEGDVLEVLKGQESESRGSVTAVHLFEHLIPANLIAVLAEIRRVLRPGGLLIAECPNPHSLRVGASLYWQDPTHQHPLLPETLELMLRAAGFVFDRRELLHPFPPDQLLADDDGGTGAVTDPEISMLAERVDRLRDHLDEILHGPRDFAVWATKPD